MIFICTPPEPGLCADVFVMTGLVAALMTDAPAAPLMPGSLLTSDQASVTPCHGQMAKNTSSVTVELPARSRDQAPTSVSTLLCRLGSDVASVRTDCILSPASSVSSVLLSADQIPAAPDIPGLISFPTPTGSEIMTVSGWGGQLNTQQFHSK